MAAEVTDGRVLTPERVSAISWWERGVFAFAPWPLNGETGSLCMRARNDKTEAYGAARPVTGDEIRHTTYLIVGGWSRRGRGG